MGPAGGISTLLLSIPLKRSVCDVWGGGWSDLEALRADLDRLAVGKLVARKRHLPRGALVERRLRRAADLREGRGVSD
jgi:hypothetical protein